MNAVESLKSLAAQRRNDAVQAARALARQLADDVAVDIVEIERVLHDAGLSYDDLAAMVETLERRRSLVAQFDAGANAEARIVEVDAAVAKLNEKLEQAREKHRQSTQPLLIEREELVEVRRAAHGAKRELLKTMPPDYRDKLDDISRKLMKLNADQKDLRTKIEMAEDVARRDRYKAALAASEDAGKQLLVERDAVERESIRA